MREGPQAPAASVFRFEDLESFLAEVYTLHGGCRWGRETTLKGADSTGSERTDNTLFVALRRGTSPEWLLLLMMMIVDDDCFDDDDCCWLLLLLRIFVDDDCCCWVVIPIWPDFSKQKHLYLDSFIVPF
jgi:hypothetical protein